MNYENRLTTEELEQDLKNERIADRELDDTTNYNQIRDIMYKIECLRSECPDSSKNSPKFTQKELAEKAGIGLSTYADYLSGTSDNIKLKTVIKIAHALRCKLSDLVDEEH